MTRARSDEGGADHGCRGDGGDGGQRRPAVDRVKRTTAIEPLLAAAVALSLASIAAGCGGSSGPPVSAQVLRRGTARLQGRRAGSWREPWRTQMHAQPRHLGLPEPVAGPDGRATKSMAAQGATWTATTPQSGQPVMPVAAARGEPTRGLRSGPESAEKLPRK